jgi:hypothetical protein
MGGRVEDKNLNDVPGPGSYSTFDSPTKDKVISYKIS